MQGSNGGVLCVSVVEGLALLDLGVSPYSGAVFHEVSMHALFQMQYTSGLFLSLTADGLAKAGDLSFPRDFRELGAMEVSVQQVYAQ